MRKLVTVFTATVDYVLMHLALIFVLFLRTPPEQYIDYVRSHVTVFSFIFLLWIALYFVFDLYSFSFSPRFSRFFFCLVIGVFISMTAFYAFPLYLITPKTNLVAMAVLFLFLSYFWHMLVDYIFVRFLHSHNILMAIADKDALYLAQQIVQDKRHKYTLQGVLCSQKIRDEAQSVLGKDMLLKSLDDFFQKVNDERIKTVVVSVSWFDRIYQRIYELWPTKLRLVSAESFYEQVFAQIPVNMVSQYWIVNNLDIIERRFYVYAKRILDIIFCILMLPLVFFVSVLIALLIKFFGSKGPIFYSQIRVGEDNRIFTLYKFRSMKVDAEKEGVKWAVDKDKRVTRIGAVLRKMRLDELPQIINIIKGEMSFIGPRPERPEFTNQLREVIPHYQIRHMVKPGLSGWAQVNYRYGSSIKDASMKLSYDLYYVKNLSFSLDSVIFLKTIFTVFTAKGR